MRQFIQMIHQNYYQKFKRVLRSKYSLLVYALLILLISASVLFNARDSDKKDGSSEVTATELSACQIYYRDVFAVAEEYATFEDYPATTTYTGPIVALDEDSHAVAKRFYSYHVAALEKGVTFGGKYTISDWAFTGWGQMFAVIDVETGKVYPFPYVVDWEFDYRPNSNLIIINPKYMVPEFDKFDSEADVSCDAKWFADIKTYYFVFENGEFKLLGPEDTSKLQTSSWLSDQVSS